jgi:lysophospholipase L1-like esterase
MTRALRIAVLLALPGIAAAQAITRPGKTTAAASTVPVSAFFPFTSAGALLPEDQGTVVEHVYPDGTQLVSTKGTAFTMLGTVPETLSSQIAGRGMAGAYSDVNRHKTTSNTNPWNVATSGLVIVEWLPNSTTGGRFWANFSSGSSGWFGAQSGTGLLYGPFSGGGGTLSPGTNNGETPGSVATACLGQTADPISFINSNGNRQRYQPSASAMTAASGAPTYFGNNWGGTGAALDGNIMEMLVLSPVSTSQAADALCTYYTEQLFGVTGFQSLRATDGTYVINGTRYTAPVNRPRITANGVVVDPAAINYFATPLTPATQTMTARAVTEPIYCWLEGSGSLALTAGTFAGTGLPCTVTSSSACLLQNTGAGGTIVATKTGTVTAANCTTTSVQTQIITTSGTYPANVMGGDIIRVPNSANGSIAGSGSVEVFPNWAATAAGVDRPVLVDSSLGVPASATTNFSLRFVAASAKWQLYVSGATVLSAAQTFAGGTRHSLAWSYTVGGQACLTVNGTQTCGGTVSAFTPGAFLTLGQWANFNTNIVTFMGMGSVADAGFAGSMRNLYLGPTANPGTISKAVAVGGDSIIQGAGGAANPFPYLLQTALGGGWTVDNHGISGQPLYVDTLNGSIHTRYWRDIQPYGYSTVVFLAGTNDLIANKTDTATEPWLQSVYDSVRTSGKHLIVLTVPPSSTFSGPQQTYRGNINTWIKAYCASNPTVTCVDIATALDNGSGALSTTACAGGACAAADLLHLSQAGYQLVSDMVYAAGHTAAYW